MAPSLPREIFPGIISDPQINSGRPVIKDTRVFVDIIVNHLESGMSIQEICYEYDLDLQQVQAVREYMRSKEYMVS